MLKVLFFIFLLSKYAVAAENAAIIKGYEGERPLSEAAILDTSSKGGILLSINPGDSNFFPLNKELKASYEKEEYFPEIYLANGDYTVIFYADVSGQRYYKVNFTAKSGHRYILRGVEYYEITDGIRKVTGAEGFIEDAKNKNIHFTGVEISPQEGKTFFNSK